MISRPLAKGDVVLATIPFTDLQAGKVRPALVVSAGQVGDDVVLVAISSNLRGNTRDLDIRIDPADPDFVATGLRLASVIRTHHLVTVESRIVARRLGRLSARLMAEVERGLSRLLGLTP